MGAVSEGKDRKSDYYFVGIIKLNMLSFIVTITTLHGALGGEAAVSAGFSFRNLISHRCSLSCEYGIVAVKLQVLCVRGGSGRKILG